MQTLSQFLTSHSDKSELNEILLALAETGKEIAAKTRVGPLLDVYGIAGGKNATGDEQQKLDVMADEMLKESMSSLKQIHAYVSEEDDEPIIIHPESKYNFYTDPLDGSKNIDVNIAIGTIFGITESGEKILTKGRDLIASGYITYSTATMFVFTVGNGTHMFTLDSEKGEYYLFKENVRMPEEGKIYSINEGNANLYSGNLKKYLQSVKDKGSSLRYAGAMVADIHRTLLKGGIFLYPADEKNINGKLRLVYEVNPMAFLVEQAGGLADTNGKDTLDIEPGESHQRVPIAIGSKKDVEEFREI